MRIRLFGIVAVVVTVLGLVGYSLGASQALAQTGTPESLPTTAATPTEEAGATPLAETGATPVAEPVRVVTLVGWYQTDASGDFIDIGPLQTTDQLVAGPGDPTSTLTGRADLESVDNNGLPLITLGDTTLAGTAMITDDPDTVFNWIYYGGDPALRPATLVIAVVATEGPYKDRAGTVTFLSRSSPGSGVFIAMLNPLPEE
ncbi:MAG TPA: hypothetical protein VFP05_07355 [Thermomicrobiales bacterium]|nr:hypothetical protein [Thermomicrobiales bacterium]